MLVGLTLPLYAVTTAAGPGGVWVGVLAAAICITGPSPPPLRVMSC